MLIRNTSLLLLLLLVCTAGRVSAQLGDRQSQIPLGSLVDSDGHIRPGSGFDGGVDMRGWSMVLDSDGKPRFLPDGTIGDGTIGDGKIGDGKIGDGGSLLAADVPGDECWASGFGPNGVYGKVYALAVKGEEVYIGGSFLIAGPILANNLVRYNFTSNTWSVLGDASSNGVSGSVYALAVFDQDVYVGGRFETAGNVAARGIARWNRQTNRWFVMGSGVASDVHNWPIVVPYSGTVYAIAVTATSVYIGGAFEQVGGEFIENLARWDFNAQKWTIPCRLEAEAPNGPVYALHSHDSTLYIGGSFSRIGPTTAANVCALNTKDGRLTPMGAGMNNAVYAISSNGNNVYAGGAFTQAGGSAASHIARWNGTAWSAMTSGTNANVRSIIATSEAIFIGGTFSSSGGVSTNCVAQWRNGEWRNMAEGMSNDSLPFVYAMAQVGGRVVGGGRFNSAGTSNAFNVAGWDTLRTEWSALGETVRRNYNGADGPIFTMALHGDDLYIGGDFANAGGVAALRVARYNRKSERWSSLGTGISGSGAFVRALAVTSTGDLYVGGIFEQAGGIPARGIARWNGTAWSAVSGGVDGTTPYVFALQEMNDDILVGGAFSTAGGLPSPKIARWKTGSSTWEAIGGGITGDTTYSFVQSIGVSGTSIYAGGLFTKAGTTTVNYIALWNGSSWGSLGSGPTAGVNATVNTITVVGPTLYIGGDFTTAGGAPAAYAAAWDGSGWSALGTGLSGPVRSIVAATGGGVILGGEFERAGGATANYIAAWSAGTGFSYYDVGANAPVRSIIVDANRLYIGGEFVRISAVRANHVAALDANGWTALGSDPSIGLNGRVLAIAVKGSEIYVGGRFRTTGGVATNGIARWDGERWATVGGGVGGTNPSVNAIAISGDGNVYAGGEFSNAGGVPAASIARWNGSVWSPLTSGVTIGTEPGVINAIIPDGNDLVVGGRFTSAGGNVAGGIAFWSGASSNWSIPANGAATGDTTLGEIYALANYKGSLYVGGRFSKVGTFAAKNHAAYDRTAQTWSNNAPDTNLVAAMALDGDDLLMASNKIDSIYGLNGLVQRIDRFHAIYRLRSGAWTKIDTGSGSVYALSVAQNGDLYVGGLFGSVGGAIATSVGRYEKASGKWKGLGSGTFNIFTEVRPDTKDTVSLLASGEVWALAATNASDGVWAGGTFQIAGSKSSSYFGYWGSCSALGVDDREVITRSNIWLNRVLPNPVQERTTIEFALPGTGDAAITIHAADGSEVARLLGERRAGGVGTVVWETGDAPAGYYFCRLMFAGRSEILPIVVVR